MDLTPRSAPGGAALAVAWPGRIASVIGRSNRRSLRWPARRRLSPPRAGSAWTARHPVLCAGRPHELGRRHQGRRGGAQVGRTARARGNRGVHPFLALPRSSPLTGGTAAPGVPSS